MGAPPPPPPPPPNQIQLGPRTRQWCRTRRRDRFPPLIGDGASAASLCLVLWSADGERGPRLARLQPRSRQRLCRPPGSATEEPADEREQTAQSEQRATSRNWIKIGTFTEWLKNQIYIIHRARAGPLPGRARSIARSPRPNARFNLMGARPVPAERRNPVRGRPGSFIFSRPGALSAAANVEMLRTQRAGGGGGGPSCAAAPQIGQKTSSRRSELKLSRRRAGSCQPPLARW